MCAILNFPALILFYFPYISTFQKCRSKGKSTFTFKKINAMLFPRPILSRKGALLILEQSLQNPMTFQALLHFKITCDSHDNKRDLDLTVMWDLSTAILETVRFCQVHFKLIIYFPRSRTLLGVVLQHGVFFFFLFSFGLK